MRYLLLYAHLSGALFTAALVTECHHEIDAPGQKLKYGLAMLLLAVVVWPAMLGAEIGEYFREQTKRFR